MRYLVYKKEKNKELFFWEGEKTHTTFACEKDLDLKKVSSVGYVLYNPSTEKWILTGTISWIDASNVETDKKDVLKHIKKFFERDCELKKRLSSQTRQNDAVELNKQNSLFARFFKMGRGSR